MNPAKSAALVTLKRFPFILLVWFILHFLPHSWLMVVAVVAVTNLSFMIWDWWKDTDFDTIDWDRWM